MESFCRFGFGALKRCEGRLLGVVGAALVLGAGMLGTHPAWGAALSWAHMASPPAFAELVHKVSFTFIPPEPEAGSRSSDDSDDDYDIVDESEDLAASSVSDSVSNDSGPVIVGATPRQRSSDTDAILSDRRDPIQDAKPSRGQSRRTHSSLTITDEPPPSVGAPPALRSYQPDSRHSSVAEPAQTKKAHPALTITDEAPWSTEKQFAVRPHQPDLQPDSSVAQTKKAYPALTVTDEAPPLADAQPALRPHLLEQQQLVYGEAALQQEVLPSAARMAVPVRAASQAAAPSRVFASPEPYAQALSAKILSEQEAPLPVTVDRQFVQASSLQADIVRQEPVSPPPAQARSASVDSFSERIVVARSDRPSLIKEKAPDVSENSSSFSVSSVTFPSAPVTVSPMAASRSVSGGGMMPSMRAPAAAMSQIVSAQTAGVIKASMIMAAGSPPASPSTLSADSLGSAGRQSVPSAQMAKVQPPVFSASQVPHGEAKVYEITDVVVDVKAESAARARDQALAKAQRIAFGQLLERLGSDVAAADTIGADALGELMQSFEVQNERASSIRYIGMFTIQFKPSAARAWLGQKKAAYSEERSGPMVILPVYVNGGRPMLWEERTRWRSAWESVARDSGLVPVIVPNGELDDISTVSTEEAVAAKSEALKALAAKYRAVGTAVVVLSGSFDHPGSGYSIQMQRVDAMGNAAPSEAVPLPVQEVGRSGSDAMLALAVKKVRQQLEADWRREHSLTSAGVTTASIPAVGVNGVVGDDDASQGVIVRLRAVVPVSSNATLENLRQRMVDVPGLTRVDVLSLQSDSARVELGLSGVIEDVQTALLERDIELRQDPIGGGWSLRGMP
ncbi:MAG: DUF2066 domain-containing protein [Bdellovibrionales bacterium]